VNHQLGEVNTIRRSLYDLESQHGKVRQHYEDEISRLRAEVTALRQSLTDPHTVTPPGIPGLSPPRSSNGHTTSGSAVVTDSFPRDRDRERTKDRGHVPMSPDCERDRERYREVERREVDRVLDQRNPKRRKSESIGPGMALSYSQH
jgi:glucose repression regulatory protein TUP1